jgi:L,D-peptidoglycan transpeptidase YkuD (ErfK/YbiS/YcfS/YnhG family)
MTQARRGSRIIDVRLPGRLGAATLRRGSRRCRDAPASAPRPDDLVVTRWSARFRGRTFPVAVGRGGIGEKAREGDGVTPRGAHRVEAVLARPDRGALPSVLPLAPAFAVPIGPRDGWSDDPADPAYNAPVRRPHDFSHEALRRADRQYDLLAVTDWNRAPVAPGRGSAIFLHVWRRPRHPTAGCIAFRREDLAWILARWTPRSRVLVR